MKKKTKIFLRLGILFKDAEDVIPSWQNLQAYNENELAKFKLIKPIIYVVFKNFEGYKIFKFGDLIVQINKKKIQCLKMGGLLAVNKGILDDPTFTILEWKPKNAKNSNPIVLVGKGIVYDTGGLSLKPTANSMDLMKIDMGGAGTIIGAINAIASNKIPVLQSRQFRSLLVEPSRSGSEVSNT